MSSSTTSLAFSKKLQEVIGEFETKLYRRGDGSLHAQDCTCPDCSNDVLHWDRVPSPSFSELIRLLPKLGEKLGLTSYREPQVQASILAMCYMEAPTEEAGMEAISAYLEKLLNEYV